MKTSNKHFLIFQKECQKWIDKFELNDYRVEYFIDEDANGARGMVKSYPDGLRAVDIFFPTELHNSTDIKKIKKAGFHEACEVLLIELRGMADEYYNFYIVNEEVHIIIRKLEKIFQ